MIRVIPRIGRHRPDYILSLLLVLGEEASAKHREREIRELFEKHSSRVWPDPLGGRRPGPSSDEG